jgi:hypothetical protein
MVSFGENKNAGSNTSDALALSVCPILKPAGGRLGRQITLQFLQFYNATILCTFDNFDIM